MEEIQNHFTGLALTLRQPSQLTITHGYRKMIKEKTGMALLASSDDTKEFTYKDGVISYEASAMGTTKKVELTQK